VSARLIDLATLSERDLAAWKGLAGRALEPNPFFEPEFVLPAHRHLDARGVGLLVAEWHGDWSACMPVAVGRWRGPVRAIRTWRHLYSFLGTPLVGGEDPAAALRTLLAAAAAERSGGLVALEWLSADGPVAAALEDALDGGDLVRAGEMPFDRAALRRTDGSGLLDRLSSRRRRELVRQRRKLEELLGAPLECSDRAGDPDAVERFLELESRSWKGREGTGMLARPANADFFREACEGFAAMGRLQLFELHAGARTVAMKCNLVASPGLFMFKIAHEEELARFSPGVQMEVENVEKFHGTDLDWIDSCANPENQMINRLWPQRRAITTLVLARRGVGGRVSQGWLRAMMAARERERRKRSAVT